LRRSDEDDDRRIEARRELHPLGGAHTEPAPRCAQTRGTTEAASRTSSLDRPTAPHAPIDVTPARPSAQADPWRGLRRWAGAGVTRPAHGRSRRRSSHVPGDRHRIASMRPIPMLWPPSPTHGHGPAGPVAMVTLRNTADATATARARAGPTGSVRETESAATPARLAHRRRFEVASSSGLLYRRIVGPKGLVGSWSVPASPGPMSARKSQVDRPPVVVRGVPRHSTSHQSLACSSAGRAAGRPGN
jgi:hypothetical protein